MKTYTITTTEDDHDTAIQNHCERCILANAIRRTLGFALFNVSVSTAKDLNGCGTIFLHSEKDGTIYPIIMAADATKYAIQFDRGYPPQVCKETPGWTFTPITFTIEVPDALEVPIDNAV